MNNGSEENNFLNDGCKYAIWGYGNSGRALSDKINYATKDKVIGFIDKNATSLRTSGMKKPVYTLDEILSNEIWHDIDGVLVSVENRNNCEDIFRTYCKKNVDKPIAYAPNSRVNMAHVAPIVWLKKEQVFLAGLQMHLMDSCNLNCRGCSHFSNLFEKGTEYSHEILLRDLERISQLIYTPRITLLGGEPLLNPRLADISSEARRLFPFSDIEVFTNGLLIPQLPDSIWPILRKNNVKYSITMYPPTVKAWPHIKAILDYQGINYIQTSSVVEFRQCYNKEGGVSHGDKSMQECGAAYCRFLRNGRLYKCPLAAMVFKYNDYFGIERLPYDEGLDITAKNFATKFIELDQPIELCKHCAEKPRMVPWQISNSPDKNEWFS